jgi:hypothetical protein
MKRKNVVVSEDAVADLEQARSFYERQQDGLGEYFIACLLSDLESLAFYAGIHSVVFGYHRMLSKRFPFAIYYESDEDMAAVVAVLDMRRNPAALSRRLSDETRCP